MIETIFTNMMKLYTPLKRCQEQIVDWAYSWVPSFLYEVHYCKEGSSTLQNIYSSKNKMPWIKCRFGKLEGHLYIKYWNSRTHCSEQMLLHTSLLTKAIHMNSTENIWAFSEEGLLTLLQAYIKDNQKVYMIDVTLGDMNIYKAYPSIVSSLCVPNKLTPKILGLFLGFTPFEEKELVYYNDEVNKIHISPKEEIVSIKTD